MKALTLNYNTPDLLDRMLAGFRRFYDIEMLLVDGSDDRYYPAVEKVVEKYPDIEMHHFEFNIHHGPGMAYGFKTITDDRIIVIDTDIVFYSGGLIARMNDDLKDESYGIGDVQQINDRGFNVAKGLAYLHPAFMLVNREVVMRYPMPIKHGAPMIRAMEALQGELLQHAAYVTSDFRNVKKVYISHDWMGTVNRTGGYHL